MKVNRSDSVHRSETSEVQKEELQKKSPKYGIAKAKDSFENTATKPSSLENQTKTIQPQNVATVVAAVTFGASSGLIVGAVAASGAIVGQAASSGDSFGASSGLISRAVAISGAIIGQAASSGAPNQESSNDERHSRQTIKKKD